MILSAQQIDSASSADAREARKRAARLRVVIVHDWLLGMRGGERVLDSLLTLFPRAEICTLFYDPGKLSGEINRRAVFPSPLSRLPGVSRYYRALLPLMPGAIDRLRLPAKIDLVISTSHCVAHGVRAPEHVPHVTYCFSPMRYLYDQRDSYGRGGSSVSASLLKLIETRLRSWDLAASRRCGEYWAISRFVAERIERAYGVAAPVIYPPVRTEYFTPGPQPRAPRDGPFLVVSALTGYKRIDIALRAANKLKKPLVIAGTGPLESKLRQMAGPTVRFLGWVDDERLRELYRTSAALIFPGEEDFGIVPLEAMACGCPVLALRAGALRETNAEGVTGEFFDLPNEDSLAIAWSRFRPGDYDPAAIRAHAEGFGEERFLNEFAMKLNPLASLGVAP